jgi:N-acetyl sugar amidotransferase
MDTSDPGIKFDNRGWCDYCCNFESKIKPNWNFDVKGQEYLSKISKIIKDDGKGKEYDCIVGLSGGLDSSYAAYVTVKKLGLRPLLLHVDAGWNTDQALGNIEKLVDALNRDLYTEVVDWESVKQMHLAFFRSGISDQDLVQDMAFFSCLYSYAKNYNIKHIITGSNFSTECVREPEDWGAYLGGDITLFKSIWKKFGNSRESNFPLMDILMYKLWYRFVKRICLHHPLNYLPFFKKDAEDELESFCGWKRFQHKHHESRFTRFFEDYWLPTRFGYDKRRAHFSSLIMTDQMSRYEALDRLSCPEMDENFTKQEFSYVAHKLDLTLDDLKYLLCIPKKSYRDYKNKRWLIMIGATIYRFFNYDQRLLR